MKRANHLYDRISIHENLHEAFKKAVKGKQTKKEVIAFQNHFDANIQKLRDQIVSEKPDIGNYHYFVVRDPKVRSICAASFQERVMHHAVMNICEPVLDSYAIFDSYACRKGKGNRKSLARAQQFARKNIWYLKLDIRKYFDSIDHSILMTLLARRFKEKKLLNLFQKVFDTYHTRMGRGLPIGNLISQHLANFYLGAFDHWIKEVRKINGYVRYMDDFILFSNEKAALKIELEALTFFLKQQLNLELKKNIQLNSTIRGIPFLGFRVYPAHIHLLASSKKRFSKKLREYQENYIKGRWSESDLNRHMEPLISFTDAGESRSFRRMVFNRFGVLS